jgi:hypothetical protein
LKPDVVPLRRRSNWVDRPAHLLSKDAGTLLVRMIEPNPITSHDWHVQPICQRSLRVVRLSGTPWIEAQACAWIVLELDAHRPISPLAQWASAFLREPFKVIKVQVTGQAKNPFEPLWITRFALRKTQSQKIKYRPAKRARADKARGRSTPGSCNGLFSVGFPTGVQRCTSCATRKTLRTSFPLPSNRRSLISDRAGHTATGRLHCSLLTLLE